MGARRYIGIWGIGLLYSSWAGWHSRRWHDRTPPVSRGVVVTITTINPNTGMAALQTRGGERFQMHKYARWARGDKVLGERRGGSRPELQRCKLWEKAAPAATAQR